MPKQGKKRTYKEQKGKENSEISKFDSKPLEKEEEEDEIVEGESSQKRMKRIKVGSSSGKKSVEKDDMEEENETNSEDNSQSSLEEVEEDDDSVKEKNDEEDNSEGSDKEGEESESEDSDDSTNSEGENDDEEEEVTGLNSIKYPITVILDKASLETVKMKSGNFSLLNCDDHQNMMRKYKKNPQDYRPDILHQELLALIDSPLNKVGKIQIFIHTEKNVLIEVNPKCRIPRTFRRFAGLMVQVLHKLKIRSSDGKETLLKVIKNPISRHFRPGSHVFAFSHLGELTSPQNLAKKFPYNEPIVLIVGAMAVGHITVNDHPYIEKMFSVSDFPLSGATALNRIVGAIEMEKNIF